MAYALLSVCNSAHSLPCEGLQMLVFTTCVKAFAKYALQWPQAVAYMIHLAPWLQCCYTVYLAYTLCSNLLFQRALA